MRFSIQTECTEPLQEDREDFQGGACKETINGDHDKEASHEVSKEDDSTHSPAPGSKSCECVSVSDSTTSSGASPRDESSDSAANSAAAPGDESSDRAANSATAPDDESSAVPTRPEAAVLPTDQVSSSIISELYLLQRCLTTLSSQPSSSPCLPLVCLLEKLLGSNISFPDLDETVLVELCLEYSLVLRLFIDASGELNVQLRPIQFDFRLDPGSDADSVPRRSATRPVCSGGSLLDHAVISREDAAAAPEDSAQAQMSAPAVVIQLLAPVSTEHSAHAQVSVPAVVRQLTAPVSSEDSAHAQMSMAISKPAQPTGQACASPASVPQGVGASAPAQVAIGLSKPAQSTGQVSASLASVPQEEVGASAHAQVAVGISKPAQFTSQACASPASSIPKEVGAGATEKLDSTLVFRYQYLFCSL